MLSQFFDWIIKVGNLTNDSTKICPAKMALSLLLGAVVIFKIAFVLVKRTILTLHGLNERT